MNNQNGLPDYEQMYKTLLEEQEKRKFENRELRSNIVNLRDELLRYKTIVSTLEFVYGRKFYE